MGRQAANSNTHSEGLWFHLRRFLIFQIKLYADAMRDFILSFIAVFAFLADVVFGRKGESSLFNGLLRLGRRTERMINLFNQYSDSEQGMDSIDGIMREVENNLRNSENRQ